MNLTAPERYRRMDESCGSMAEPQSRDELIKIPVGYKKKNVPRLLQRVHRQSRAHGWTVLPPVGNQSNTAHRSVVHSLCSGAPRIFYRLP